MKIWDLIVGEFPPQPGGVADHSLGLARGLAAAGCTVRVWCPGMTEAPRLEKESAISVRRIAAGFGPKGLSRLGQALDEHAGPKTLFVQYAPHSFGFKAMNLPLCFWLQRRRSAVDEIHVLFHEVAFPFVRKPLRHNLLAAVHRLMARLVLKAATRVYVTTPSWEPLLRNAGWRGECQWLPVPSNIPVADPEEADSVGRKLLANGVFLVGHFGTYGPGAETCLAPAMRLLKERVDGVRFALMWRGGDDFLEH
jgi:hypothetical protein